jgi:hypothetical protein
MDKTIAKLPHAEQPRARTNPIVPPPHFPIRLMAKRGESASCRHGTKFHLWKKRGRRRVELSQRRLTGGRDQARPIFTKKPLCLFSDILPYAKVAAASDAPLAIIFYHVGSNMIHCSGLRDRRHTIDGPAECGSGV